MPTGFETLTSTSNEKVRFLRALSDAKTRRESGLMRAEGRKLCYEAARCLPVDTLFCDEEKWDDYAELICLCTDKGAKIYPTTRRIIEYVSEARTPQDVVLSAAIPSLPLGDGPIAALDGVQDPGNCGTIIRTCDAAGFAGVVLGPGCADPPCAGHWQRRPRRQRRSLCVCDPPVQAPDGRRRGVAQCFGRSGCADLRPLP